VEGCGRMIKIKLDENLSVCLKQNLAAAQFD
jgi:hypothetical protein